MLPCYQWMIIDAEESRSRRTRHGKASQTQCCKCKGLQVSDILFYEEMIVILFGLLIELISTHDRSKRSNHTEFGKFPKLHKANKTLMAEQASSVEKGKWRYVGPSPRYGHTSSIVPEFPGHFIVIGGCGGANHYLNDVHVYDTENGRWYNRVCEGNVPSPRAFHTACVWKDSIYVFGGKNVSGVSNGLHIFNIHRGWMTISRAQMPVRPAARSNHCACVVGDRMFVFGGDSKETRMHALHLETLSWSDINYQGSMPVCCGQRACEIEGKIVLLLSSYAPIFCVPFPCFLHLASLFHLACVFCLQYVFGGVDDAKSLCSNKTHVFDPVHSVWTTLEINGLVPSPRKHYSFAVHGGALYMMGGVNQNDIPLGDVWRLDLSRLEWRTVEPDGDPPCARSLHTSVVCSDRFYVFGGTDEDNSQQSVFNDIHICDLPIGADDQKVDLSHLPQSVGKFRNLMQNHAFDEHMETFCKTLDARLTEFERRMKIRDEYRLAIMEDEKVVINVGGKRFHTSVRTLTSGTDHMLAAMFSGTWKMQLYGNEYFIDRDGTHFRYILNYLRDGHVVLPESAVQKKELLIEANFYQLDGLVSYIQSQLGS